MIAEALSIALFRATSIVPASAEVAVAEDVRRGHGDLAIAGEEAAALLAAGVAPPAAIALTTGVVTSAATRSAP